MRRFAVRYLVTLPRTQSETPAVRKRCFKFAVKAENYMPLRTPMIRRISSRIFHHPHANLANVLCPPKCDTRITGMLGSIHLRPIRRG